MLFINLYQYTKVFQCDTFSFITTPNSLTNTIASQNLQWGGRRLDELNVNQNFNMRTTKFMTTYSARYRKGRNMIENRLTLINNKIELQAWANSTSPRYSTKTRSFGNYSCVNLWKSRPSYSTRVRVQYLYFRRIWRILVESSQAKLFVFSTIHGS